MVLAYHLFFHLVVFNNGGKMNIIKAIINDLRTDIRFLKELVSGEYKFPYTLKEVLDIRPMLKDPKTYLFFMILFIAIMVGTQISAKHYQKLANEEIIDAQYFVDLHCSNASMYKTGIMKLNIPEFENDIEIDISPPNT